MYGSSPFGMAAYGLTSGAGTAAAPPAPAPSTSARRIFFFGLRSIALVLGLPALF